MSSVDILELKKMKSVLVESGGLIYKTYGNKSNEWKEYRKEYLKIHNKIRYYEDEDFRNNKMEANRIYSYNKYNEDEDFRKNKIEANRIYAYNKYNEDEKYRTKKIESSKNRVCARC